MIHHTIQGTRVPALGFGTWKLAGRACRDAVEDALALGYRHLDTATIYGNESEVGAALNASGVPRADVFLTTKVWYEDLDPIKVRESLHASLLRLQTEYVDLLLVHWPNPAVPLGKTLDALFKLQAAGKTRHVGVSNFPAALFEQACALGPVFCNQVEYHPYLSQADLIRRATAHDALLTAYSPLVRGKVEDDDVLEAIGARHGKSAAQVTLRWLVQQERVAAVPKAASPEHRRANLDVFDFDLSPDEMARIHGLARGYRRTDPDFAPDWD